MKNKVRNRYVGKIRSTFVPLTTINVLLCIWYKTLGSFLPFHVVIRKEIVD